jgi:sugar phosphate permease
MNRHLSHYHDHQRPLTGVGIFFCLIGLLAIAFSITLRVVPSAIPSDVLTILQLSPHIFDQLNASYQYSLIACLLLSGLVVDIVGPRTVIAIALTLAVIANYYFGSSANANIILNSRVLINYTHPFILIAVLTLGTHWLPRRHFSLFVGLLFGLLLMAPVIDTYFLQNISSRETFEKATLLIDMLGILVVISYLVTERVADRTRHRHTFVGLVRPLRYYKVWLISLVSMLGWMTNTFILHNGTLFLLRYYHTDLQHAASIIDNSFMFFGIGAVFMGFLSDILRRSKRHLIAMGYCLAAFTFSILIYVPDVPGAIVPTLVYATAFFTSSTIICYTKTNDYCTIGNSGITLGLMLAVTTIGSSFFARQTGSYFREFINDPSVMGTHYLLLVLTSVPVILLTGAVIALWLLKPVHLHAHHHHPTPQQPKEVERV